MSPKTESKNRYFELSEHNSLQFAGFGLLAASCAAIVFLLLIPVLQSLFENFLNGKVFNSGETLSYYANMPKPLQTTNYIFSWAVDLYFSTDEPSRYWFSPFISLVLPAGMLGIVLSVILTTILPERLGLMRCKIEREILNQVGRLSIRQSGQESDEDIKELQSSLFKADIRFLHSLSGELKASLDDLKAIAKAIKWQRSNLFYKILHFNHALNVYMRFYFTVKYSNSVLGLVYVGAAVLIIIIGLRGLKFIPPTQPSIIIFSLGLEFSLLITYAITLMYSRQEEEDKPEQVSDSQSADNFFVKTELGEHSEVEKLLRVFIKSKN